MLAGGKLDIVIQNPTLLFHGSEETTGAKLIYGKVLVNLKSDKKVKGINISIYGGKVLNLPGGARKDPLGFNVEDAMEPKNLFLKNSESIFLSDSKAGTPFAPGSYEFPFMIKVPGDLPATVSTDILKI
ncbi:hypothetical protein AYI68_g5562, partial [Smittium mucronatum]